MPICDCVLFVAPEKVVHVDAGISLDGGYVTSLGILSSLRTIAV